MSRVRVHNAHLLLGSLLFCLIAFELTARFLMAPSGESYGRLFGADLVPLRVLPLDVPDRNARDGEAMGLVIDGREIRMADLYGIYREDPIAGYAPRESTVSPNGWWHSNNIGARARKDTTRQSPGGFRRLVVFGDSYAAGSRVPQDSAWPRLMELMRPGLEVVNMAVDGYSVGQSYLRYQKLRDTIHAPVVLLTFSPYANLWREVNTIRYLGEEWDSYTVMPRFVLDGGELRLIPGPYEPGTEVYRHNHDGVSDGLRAHLRRFDSFYSAWVHEEPALAGRLMFSRLLGAVAYRHWRARMRNRLIDPSSEATRLCREIFIRMDREVRERGGRFVLAILPGEVDLDLLTRNPSYRQRWLRLARSVCGDGMTCIDVSEALRTLPEGTIDEGYDGTHYGPGANRIIADLMARRLEALSLIDGDAVAVDQSSP